jgi:RNA polymerase sigma-70 factor (ECF subfamily)
MIPSEQARALRRARAGCRFAFARLWATHEDKVRRLVARRAPAELVEDVVQDTALAALHGIGALRAGGDFAAWVLAIAGHRAASAYQRFCRERARLDLRGSFDADVADDSAERWRRDQRQVLGWLRRLPRCYRLPLWLRFVHDCSAGEIAARLGTTQGTVRVALCRGLRHLRAVVPVAPCA